jgi:hypothetical protein
MLKNIPETKRKRPNLFLVGAMKSGSTTLHDYLSEHPDIFMSTDKEPGFFVPEFWKNKSEEKYNQLFTEAKSEIYLGESSTHYTKLPTYLGVAEKIYQYNSNAKIIYIVRHPIKRTISHYLHNRRDLYLHAENRDILNAIEQDEIYTAYSHYAMQIKPYYDYFGKANVCIVLFEEMIASPEKVLKEIFQWLDVDPDFPIKNSKKSNATPVVASTVRGGGLLNKLRYSSFWNWLSPLFPQQLKKLGNIMAEKKESVIISSVENDEVHNKLRSLYQAQTHDLEELTERSFAVWKL